MNLLRRPLCVYHTYICNYSDIPIEYENAWPFPFSPPVDVARWTRQQTRMTAIATPPLTESTTSPSPPHQEWSCQATMPPLSEVVSGWHEGLKDHDNLGGEVGVGGGGKGNGDRGIPPHRRKIVRTRAAPAGPHPYLDRFASGMHRPLEGEQREGHDHFGRLSVGACLVGQYAHSCLSLPPTEVCTMLGLVSPRQ